MTDTAPVTAMSGGRPGLWQEPPAVLRRLPEPLAE